MLHPHAALLLLPDPVQPFKDSVYTQRQVFEVPPDGTASFVVLDWVSEGRSARGEKWEMGRFESRNEVYSGGRLLLRDAVVLDAGDVGGEGLAGRMDGMGVFATVLVGGERFEGLVKGVVERFGSEPRVGGRGFAVESVGRRWEVVWTAARVRGFLLVKVSGRELEEVRGFLKELLEEGGRDERGVGDVVREFGEEALRCLQ